MPLSGWRSGVRERERKDEAGGGGGRRGLRGVAFCATTGDMKLRMKYYMNTNVSIGVSMGELCCVTCFTRSIEQIKQVMALLVLSPGALQMKTWSLTKWGKKGKETRKSNHPNGSYFPQRNWSHILTQSRKGRGVCEEQYRRDYIKEKLEASLESHQFDWTKLIGLFSQSKHTNTHEEEEGEIEKEERGKCNLIEWAKEKMTVSLEFK